MAKKKNPETVNTTEQESGRDSLGRFKPGVSGNPGGRPAGVSWRERLLRALESKPELLDAIIAKELELAVSGDPGEATAARKHIADRLDGKPKESIEHTQTGPIQIVDATDMEPSPNGKNGDNGRDAVIEELNRGSRG